MTKNWIKNFEELATSPLRRKALEIINRGFESINTAAVLNQNVSLNENKLKIKNEELDLGEFGRIIFIGIGKAAGEAALFFDKLLGPKITAGIALDLKRVDCRYIRSFAADHPHPSLGNVSASQKIVDLAKGISESDLVIAIISGGGSAMLCWPEEECDQSQRLYDAFLKTGGNIAELNAIRKHTSLIKGGGLAKIFYPAKIASLIFSDIGGDSFDLVASGPTYFDKTTIQDAEEILKKHGIGGINLLETPKEEKYFQNVTNIPILSNKIALEAMAAAAQEDGLKTTVISPALYDTADAITDKFKMAVKNSNVVLGGGETGIAIKTNGGKGGRCQFLALSFLPLLEPGEVFAAVASDGFDNSDAAGAIVDGQTLAKIQELDLNPKEYLINYNTYDLFAAAKDLIFTDPIGANVADLMLLLRE